MERKRSINPISHQRLPVIILCGIALLTVILFSPVSPTFAHHIQPVHSSSCGGYAFKMEYIGGKGEFKLVWDMTITIDGAAQTYKGEKELINTSRFVVFDIKQAASSAHEKGFVELFEKDSATGEWKSMQIKEYDTNVRIVPCPSPTPDAIPTPTLIITTTPTPTVAVERGDSVESNSSNVEQPINDVVVPVVEITATPVITPEVQPTILETQAVTTNERSAVPTATPAQIAQVNTPSSESSSTQSNSTEQSQSNSNTQSSGQVAGAQTTTQTESVTPTVLAPTGNSIELVKRIAATAVIVSMLISKELAVFAEKMKKHAKKTEFVLK